MSGRMLTPECSLANTKDHGEIFAPDLAVARHVDLIRLNDAGGFSFSLSPPRVHVPVRLSNTEAAPMRFAYSGDVNGPTSGARHTGGKCGATVPSGRKCCAQSRRLLTRWG